jgi:hypothetical protein
MRVLILGSVLGDVISDSWLAIMVQTSPVERTKWDFVTWYDIT